MFGHRADGKRLSDIDPIVRITPYMMPMRCDAMVFLEHRLDYEMLARYIAQKAREDQQVTVMQILVAAYVRAISTYPEANRYIMNKQLFARSNCSVAFTILQDPNDADKGEAEPKKPGRPAKDKE